jgi:hypothetical protein
VKKALVICTLFSLVVLFSYCRKQGTTVEETSPYLNQHDTVDYVGMETCRQCHSDKFDTYIHTGMGLSFGLADTLKSAAEFGPHVNVYDSVLDFYYHPFWKSDTLMITEYRLDGSDTVHSRTEAVQYIIGSGQHTNSHLLQVNGYLFQAPITYYTQKKQWDLAPGMNGGFNSRFSRVIESECITCHNGLPEQIAGSVNKYTAMPLGIDCERCHGPGEAHVARISSGIAVDTSNAFDYSIVNPRGLSTELQNDLCFRCHLQGVNVLLPGAEYADFRPGDHIRDHWNVFLPRFDGRNDQFLMASQADRMVQSKCFISSGEMSCITCHNPHLTVKETPIATFNQPCQQCHSPGKTQCTETLEVRNVQDDNCSGCHIPKSGSIDIPHVSISDHKIQIPGREKEKPEGKFLGLKAITDPNIAPIQMARGYLRYFEGFVSEQQMLDSARYWLSKSKQDELYISTEIHILYLENNYTKVVDISRELELEDMDAWTAYRVGESYFAGESYDMAVRYFERAVAGMPYNLDFNLKYGSSLFLMGNTDQAGKIFQFITGENPRYEKAWMNLATYYGSKGRLVEAEKALYTAVQLNPDYLQARLGLCDLLLRTRQKTKAADTLKYLNRYHANEPLVQQLNKQYRSL